MKHNNFETNYQWQEKFYPEVENILRINAMYLIDVTLSSYEQDTRRATDMVINVDGGAVALRIRRPGPWRDLTIRAYKTGNRINEIDKIRKGMVDWYLYCWTDNENIKEWMLVDINAMLNKGEFDSDRRIQINGDGASGFIKYERAYLRECGYIINERRL